MHKLYKVMPEERPKPKADYVKAGTKSLAKLWSWQLNQKRFLKVIFCLSDNINPKKDKTYSELSSSAAYKKYY